MGFRALRVLGVTCVAAKLFRMSIEKTRDLLKGCNAGLCYLLVLVNGAAADAYSPYHLDVTHEREPAGKDDDPTAVVGVDAKQRLARGTVPLPNPMVMPLST